MSNSRCSLHSCSNKKTNEMSLFTVPTNEILSQKWIDFLKNNGNTNIRNGATYRLCEDHFPKNSIRIANGKKSLVQGTIPTNNLRRSVRIIHMHNFIKLSTIFNPLLNKFLE